MLLQILAELGARKDNTARKHKHLLDSLAIARPVLRSQTKLRAKHEHQVEPHAGTHGGHLPRLSGCK